MVRKIAYLTIDDAPSVDMKEKVDFLVSKGIPAIWFCTGSSLEKRSELAIYAIKKDFIIGNHSYTHPHLHFSDLSLEQCFEEIQKTDRIVDEIYKKASVKRPAKFFRFPFGDKGGLNYDEVFKPYEAEGKVRKERIQAFLKSLGYMQPKFENITYRYYRKAGLLDDVDWYWTYDLVEWSTFTEEHLFGIDSLEKVFERLDEDVPEDGRGLNYPDSEEIILIHDHPETTPIFKPLIERLLAKGLIFKLPSLK